MLDAQRITASAPRAPGTQDLSLALLLPGQGAQYPGMGTGLYRAEPEFAAVVDEVFDAMGRAGADLRADWLAAEPGLPMDHVTRSQPLLFALDYALGRLLLAQGLRPAVLLGHSIGEVAAATLAGVFDLGTAARMVQERVTLLSSAPVGGMAAVAAPREEIAPLLVPGVDIGAVNAPRQTILAGRDEPLRATVAALRAAGFTCAPVASLTPFHSAVLEPVVEPIRRRLGALPLTPPAVPVVSGYTAAPLTDEQAVDPAYWARHPVDPVLFWPALEDLMRRGDHLLVECGPGQSLVTLARRHPAVRSGRSRVLALLGPAGAGPDAEAEHFRAMRAELTRRTP
ncbi:acyltransferase domain-containing protein [Streptomyces celluloflavus]|uniref:acyltransferase domain-containing protein n=1 Tax=Streptomyces celluloflavus TaxID=58344 RepID=UPI003668DFEA